MATEPSSGAVVSSLQRTVLGVLIAVTWLVAMLVLDQDGGALTLATAVAVTVLAAGGVDALVIEGIHEG